MSIPKILRQYFLYDRKLLSERSKGFGFVEMPEPAEARSAIMSLNGQTLKGRTITVNEARPDSQDRRGKGRGDRRGEGQY